MSIFLRNILILDKICNTHLDDDEGGQRLCEAVLGGLVQAPYPGYEGLPVGASHGDPQHQLQEPASYKYYPHVSLCQVRILSSDKCAVSTIVMLPCCHKYKAR